ncbi:uncharacterized protein LOC127527627 [Erpetoichthys calabaricus]|uniref:uncharacterized protein LOC127527627 n=1 Tax=Erpetoichthys calabaricus TaxID=27687 RepID=UPI002234BE3A|nr:uncharacterized protein LOC127527627 [Erpetoichthys calabaricus]
MDSKSISLSEEMVLRCTHWIKMLLMLFLIACIMLCGHSKKETIEKEFGKNISLICSNHTWSELVMQKWTIWKLGIGNCDIAVHYNGTITSNCTNNPVYINSTNPHLSISNFGSNYVGKYSCDSNYNGGTDTVDYYLWGIVYINHTFGKDVSLNCTQQRSGENINEMQQHIKYNEECLAVGINQPLNSTCRKKEGITTEIKDEQIYIHINNFQLNDTGNYTCESSYNEEKYKIVFILTGKCNN